MCPSPPHRIMVRASPFGSDGAAVPTARCISLSRIPTPISNSRKYESLCIAAVQSYFATSRRLVKEGDVIPLCIDVDSLLDPRLMSNENGFVMCHHCRISLMICHSHQPRYPANVLICFVVSSVEPEPVTVSELLPSVPNIGCFVDVTTTRIVQVGTASGRIPDMNSYFTLGAFHHHYPCVV